MMKTWIGAGRGAKSEGGRRGGTRQAHTEKIDKLTKTHDLMHSLLLLLLRLLLLLQLLLLLVDEGPAGTFTLPEQRMPGARAHQRSIQVLSFIRKVAAIEEVRPDRVI